MRLGSFVGAALVKASNIRFSRISGQEDTMRFRRENTSRIMTNGSAISVIFIEARELDSPPQFGPYAIKTPCVIGINGFVGITWQSIVIYNRG